MELLIYKVLIKPNREMRVSHGTLYKVLIELYAELYIKLSIKL